MDKIKYVVYALVGIVVLLLLILLIEPFFREDFNYSEKYKSKMIKIQGNKVNEKLHGIVYEYYDRFNPNSLNKYKGFLKSETNFKNGLKNGESKTYYKSGELLEIKNYVNDTLHGLYTSYHKNGNVKTRQMQVNGAMDGLVYEYYSNGSVKYEWNVRKDQIGKRKNYYKNGKLGLEADVLWGDGHLYLNPFEQEFGNSVIGCFSYSQLGFTLKSGVIINSAIGVDCNHGPQRIYYENGKIKRITNFDLSSYKATILQAKKEVEEKFEEKYAKLIKDPDYAEEMDQANAIISLMDINSNYNILKITSDSCFNENGDLVSCKGDFYWFTEDGASSKKNWDKVLEYQNIGFNTGNFPQN